MEGKFRHDSHLVIISSDSEGEATLDGWIFRLVIRILQRAACQEGFLTLVESYRSKFLPVIDKRLLREDLMQSYLALPPLLASNLTKLSR